MTEKEAAIKLTDLENRAKSNSHRLDKLEEGHEAIGRLATAVEVMAKSMERIEIDVSKLDTKVEALEQKPGKQWESTVKILATAVISVLVGFVFAHWGIG